jgi:hypothetical protein
MSESEKIIIKKRREKQKVIKLVFPENLLKSLNKMQKKQNNELMKVISLDKSIPLKTLTIFLDDRLTETINVNGKK